MCDRAQKEIQKIDDILVFEYVYYILRSIEGDSVSGHFNNIFNGPPNGGLASLLWWHYREQLRWCQERCEVFCDHNLISLSGVCMGNTLSNCNGAWARNETCNAPKRGREQLGHHGQYGKLSRPKRQRLLEAKIAAMDAFTSGVIIIIVSLGRPCEQRVMQS